MAGVSVSVLGVPVIDAAAYVKVPFLPKFDLGSFPGFGLLKKVITGPMLNVAGRYPAVAHIPILDFSHPAVKQLTMGSKDTGQHVITVRVKGARNLHAADWGGASDPYAVLVMAGEAVYETRQRQTSVVQSTLNPRWEAEFTFTLSDIEDAGEIMIAVFDSDGTSLMSKAIDPKKVLENLRPVMHFQKRSLELAERFQLGVTDIPWDPAFHKLCLSATPPGKPPSMITQIRRKLTAARKADVSHRAATEAPVLPRPKTEAQRKKEKDHAKKKVKAEKTTAPTKCTSVEDSKKVTSDVERCVRNQTVAADNDLLGMTMVDFKSILEPGKTVTMWFSLDGCPSGYRKLESEAEEEEEEDEEEEEEEKEGRYTQGYTHTTGKQLEEEEEKEEETTPRITSDDNVPPVVVGNSTRKSASTSQLLRKSRGRVAAAVARSTSSMSAVAAKRGRKMSAALASPFNLPGLPRDSNGAAAKREKGKGPPEIELELSWNVYDEVRQKMPAKDGGDPSCVRDEDGVKDEGDKGQSGVASGSLHVEVLRASDLSKPRSNFGKMSSSKVMPRVELKVARQSARTDQARGLNPTFNEHFDFPNINYLNELTVSVVHPRKKRSSLTGLWKDRTMGVVAVPLHGVVRSGAASGSYKLEGVKCGEVHLNLMYRAEKNYDELAAETAAEAAAAAAAEAAAAAVAQRDPPIWNRRIWRRAAKAAEATAALAAAP